LHRSRDNERSEHTFGDPPASGQTLLRAIWQALSWAEANKAFALFLDTFQAKYLQVIECLANDREELLSFCNVPLENRCHIRTTNPIEGTFAMIRLRHRKVRGGGPAKARSMAATSRLRHP
jgi:putative transposase